MNVVGLCFSFLIFPKRQHEILIVSHLQILELILLSSLDLYNLHFYLLFFYNLMLIELFHYCFCLLNIISISLLNSDKGNSFKGITIKHQFHIHNLSLKGETVAQSLGNNRS